MRIKEFLVVFILTIVGYLLTYLVTYPFYVYANILIVIFYVFMLLGKLPIDFYPQSNKDLKLYNKIIIIIGIMLSLSLVCLFKIPFNYLKIIGRICFYSLIITTFCVLFPAMIRKFFTNYPQKEFNQRLFAYIRSVLFILANVAIIPFVMYNYKAQYKSGILIYKNIQDGPDTYITTRDSLGFYQTRVTERMSKKMEYIIYYDEYPDKINHIDTLSIRK